MSADQTTPLLEDHDGPAARPVPLGPVPTVAEDDERPLPRTQRVTPSAADITSERMLRAQAEAPPSGWRRALFQLTRGAINPGPSAADRERRDLIGHHFRLCASRSTGRHNAHAWTMNPRAFAWSTTCLKDSRICACWALPTPSMKNLACQTETTPSISPTMTSRPQSPGLASTLRTLRYRKRTSCAINRSKVSRAPSFPPAPMS